MRAPEFYQHLEGGFNAEKLPSGLKKMGGKALKWKIAVDDGALEFKIATNSKGAGLLDLLLWPGEHRMTVHWITGRGA